MVDFPTSLVDFQRRFPDEASCAAWLFEARWPTGFRCPACDHDKGWPHGGKAFTYECAACGRQTSVTAGTIMHGSKLPLTVWFWAAYLMATHSNGISALQLQRLLALGSYKSAWLLCAKLRRAMVAPSRALLAGIAEIDETEVPLRAKDDLITGGGGRSSQSKMLVAGAATLSIKKRLCLRSDLSIGMLSLAPRRPRPGTIRRGNAAGRGLRMEPCSPLSRP